jgi:branched-chain amino acid transport system substrate-binding protein
VCQQNRVPFLINTGAADNITEQGWEYIFRLNPPVSEYASGLEEFLSEVVKGKTAVILYENTLFGTKGAEAFRGSCEKLGIKILSSEGYEHGNIDFKPVLVRIKELNPDIVYMISYVMDATLLMRQSMELKLAPRLFAGGGAGFTLPEFYKNTRRAGEKVVSATLWHQVLPLEGAMDYFRKFRDRYQMETEYHGAEAYAAAYVIADVLKRAESFGADHIRQSLSQTDMMTVFGPVKFVSYGKKTNQNRLKSYVVQWQDGELKLIWPEKLANSRYVFPVNWLEEWGY